MLSFTQCTTMRMFRTFNTTKHILQQKSTSTEQPQQVGKYQQLSPTTFA